MTARKSVPKAAAAKVIPKATPKPKQRQQHSAGTRKRAQPQVPVGLPPQFSPLLYSVDYAAASLGVSRWTMNKLIQTAEVRSLTVGHRRCIPIKALEEYIARRLAASA